MEIYLRVRRAHYQNGLSGREIARQFGISRDSVRKMLTFSEPPGYRRTAPVRSRCQHQQIVIGRLVDFDC